MPAAISRITGRKITGTLEKLLGTANICPDSFEFKDGELVDFDHEGYTNVDWDSQETAKAENGDRIFVDEDGNEVQEKDVVPAGTALEAAEDVEADAPKDDERELLISMVNRLLPDVPEGANKQAARDLLRSIWN